MGVWRLAFGVWRLAFGVWRLAFGVWRLAFGGSAGRRLCPEGTIGLSPGFQPREYVHTMSRPEGAEDVYDRRSIWSTPPRPMHRFYRPFRAGRFMNRHLGLKPQAESCSPFGTQKRAFADTVDVSPIRPITLSPIRRFAPSPTRYPCGSSLVPTGCVTNSGSLPLVGGFSAKIRLYKSSP
jgi:hypothetical protein